VQGDVENVTGGPGADTLTGSPVANVLDGAGGADTITGGDGADTLLGGTENDHLKSVDGAADSDDCGAGTGDKVTKDAFDTATGCELVAPASTAAPTISGTERDGETLEADPGTWSGTDPIAFAYKWRRCDGSGATCADIAGATASSYTLTPADVDATLRVLVTATNAADATTAESAQTGQVEPAPPANGSLPTVSGTPQDGEQLTASPGTWSGTPPVAFAYQWRRCAPAGGACADISGATGQTHMLTPADIGSELRVRVTASNAAPAPTSADSDPTAQVKPAPPLNSALPALAGTAQDGQQMTATPGTWSGTPAIAFAYQWLSCDADVTTSCTAIPGAIASSYTATATEVARRLRVRVKATNSGGEATVDSDPSLVVLPAPGGGGSGGESGGGGSAGGGTGGGGGGSGGGGGTTPADASAPGMQLTLTGLALQRVLSRGLVMFVELSEPATVEARLELSRRAARGLGLASAAAAKPVIVGKRTANATAAGRLRVVVKLTKRARRRLAGARRVRLTVRLTAADAAGNLAKASRKVVLKG
jgi:RTX calcium-binding nonapeptide repeat (4 copies)